MDKYKPEKQESFNERFRNELIYSPRLGSLGLTDSNKTKVVMVSPDNPRSIERGVGLQIIANAVSHLPYAEVDIACNPYPNVASTLGSNPLQTIYSNHPVGDADIVGFSISNPMLFYNTFKFFDRSQISPYVGSEDRKRKLVIAGGLGITNPAPFEDFIDAFVIGEGDDAIVRITEEYDLWRKGRSSKQDLLDSLTEIPGVYVPSAYDRIIEDDILKEIIPKNEAPEIVEFQKMQDVDNYRRSSLISSEDHAFLFLDFSCKYKCTFCQMSNVRGKYFDRSLDNIIEDLEELDASGIKTVTLASNTSTNFPEENLISIFGRAQDLEIKPLIRSVRIDRLTNPLFAHILQDYLHIAPETGTDRLRNSVLHKGMKNTEIFSNVDRAVELGINDVRMYSIVGIPTETDHDRDELAKLISRVGNTIGDKHDQGFVRVDMYPLLPQVGTPLEQSDLIGLERFNQIYNDINNFVQANVADHINAEINPLKPIPHLVEGIANLGGRDSGHLLLRAYQSEKKGKSTLKAIEDELRRSNIEYRDVIRAPRYEVNPWKVVQTRFQPRIDQIKKRLKLVELNGK